jgi:hypothetical protein
MPRPVGVAAQRGHRQHGNVTMNLGYRHFIVREDHSIVHLSRRAFDDFYFGRRSSLPRYSGSVLTIATVIYATENRKPKQIVRIECTRVKVDSSGGLDEDHIDTTTRLLADRINKFIGGPRAVEESGSVINALEKFDERRWANLHPPLSGPAYKRIYESLFGRSHAIEES